MILTPIKAIRAKCLDCCCGNMAEVRRCPAEKCSLHPYRMGHRPKMDADTQADTHSTENADSPPFSQQKPKTKAPLCDDRPK